MKLLTAFFLLVATIVGTVHGQSLGKSNLSNDPVVRYSARLSTPMESAMDGLSQSTTRRVGAMMMGAPEVVRLNMNLIRSLNGKKILDVGMYTGYSALGAAIASGNGGKVITMDIQRRSYEQANAESYFREAGVLNNLDIRIAPAKDTMQGLINNGESGTFDFCFIDADKSNQANYYDQCLRLLKPRGIITIDNSLWGGSVVRQQKSSSARIIDNLNQRIGQDTRVWASLLPIADGLWVIVKK